MAESVDDGRNYRDDKNAHSFKGLGLSDQLIDLWCDLCYDHSRQKIEPDGFCAECNSFVFKSCIEGHKKVPVLRNHRIIRGSKMPKSQADKPIKYLNCDIHDGRVSDQFCLDHGTMVCSQCIRESHQHCHTKDILFICKHLGIDDYQHLKDTIASLKQKVVSIKATLEGNITDIIHQQKDMIKETENMRDTLVKEIQHLCSKTVSNIKDTCRQKCADINDKVSTLTDVVHSLDDAICDIDKTTVHANFGPNQFIRLHDIVNRARLGKKQIEDERNELNKAMMSFSSASDIVAVISKSKQLGNVKDVTSEIGILEQLPEIIFPQFQRQRMRTPEKEQHRDIMTINTTQMTTLYAKTSKKTRRRSIGGMDVASNDTLLIVDYANKSMKSFSSDNKLLSSLAMSDHPFDISVIDNKRAAVCTKDNKLYILDISGPAAPSVQKSVSLPYTAVAVTTCNNNLIVISSGEPKCVKMIDLNGEEMWSTSADRKGAPLFSCPEYVTTTISNNKTTIIVTGRVNATLTVLDASNGHLIRTVGVSGKDPCSLTTDDDGNVYVCSCGTKEICVWSADLTQCRILLSGSDIMSYPRRIIYYTTTDEIAVSFVGNNRIYRFRLL